MANDFESKLGEITQNFTAELKKVKTEVLSTKETLYLNTLHFNGEMKNVSSYFDTALKDEIEKLKTDLKWSKETLQRQTVHFNEELRKVKGELRSSKRSLNEMQRENSRLRENLENGSKTQDIIMSNIQIIARTSMQEIEKLKTELTSSKESFQLKNDHFDEEMIKMKTDLRSSKETLDLKSVHFNREIEKVKAASQSSQTRLKASLVQLQRENALLKKILDTASENQIYFDYSLSDHMTSTGYEIVKFDVPRAVSSKKIYDESTGKVTIEEAGLYYFFVHGYPYEESDVFYLEMYIDDEEACSAWKRDGTKAHMSCAIVRDLKTGQQIYVKKYNKLYGSNYPATGFSGFKLQ